MFMWLRGVRKQGGEEWIEGNVSGEVLDKEANTMSLCQYKD